MKRFWFLGLVGVLVVSVWAASNNGSWPVYVSIASGRDTAQCVKFTPTAICSLTYRCTLTTGEDDSTLGFDYTTLAQRIAVTPGAGVDSFTYIDTFLFGTGNTKIEVKWTSPSYKVTATPTSALDSTLYWAKFSFCNDSAKWTSPAYSVDVTPSAGLDSFFYHTVFSFMSHDSVKWTSPLYAMDLTPSTALDSFPYLIKFSFMDDSAKWTSPSFKMDVTPSTGLDSTIYWLLFSFCTDTVKWTSKSYYMDATPSTALDSALYWVKFSFMDDSIKWTSLSYKMDLTPSTALDSFPYWVKFSFCDDSAKWTSASFKMDMTPSTAIDDTLYWVKFSFCDDSVKWTSPAAATDIAMICDSMVKYINAATTIKDSVKAVDGTTKITINSLKSQAILANWTASGDTTWDTATANHNTIARTCDSLNKAINDLAIVTDSVNSTDGTTKITVNSLKPQTILADWTVTADTTIDTANAYNCTVARICDSLTAGINANATASGLVFAVDGTTKFTTHSKFSEVVLSNWSMSGDTSEDFTPTSPTTVAMICDSLTKAVNDATTISDSVKATDNTTKITINSLVAQDALANWTLEGDGTEDTATAYHTTIANVCDSLVAAINAATDMQDSVLASDSTSKITVVSKFSELNLADWTVQGDSTIDTSNANNTTVAMVCDSMVAATNALSGVSDSVVASDGTTKYVLKSRVSEAVLANWTMKADATQDTTAVASPTTVAMVCDSMVKYINAAATIKDSVKATDGTTKYVVNSLKGEATLANWTLTADSCQHGAITWQTTVAQACSAMTAAIEAATYVTDSVEAKDSTTRYIIHAIVEGLRGQFGLKIGDTTQDTTTRYVATAAEITDSLTALINAAPKTADELVVEDSGSFFRLTSAYAGRDYAIPCVPDSVDTSLTIANARGRTVDTQTVFIGSCLGARTVHGRVVLSNDRSAIAGIGSAGGDTVIITVYSANEWERSAIATDTSTADTSCSVTFSVPEAVGDTLLRTWLEAFITVIDTTSDTTFEAWRTIDWNYYTK